MIDRLYPYYFLQTKRQVVHSLVTFAVSMLYVSAQVFVWGRAEAWALGEAVCLAMLFVVVFPLVSCRAVDPTVPQRQSELLMFSTLWYRRHTMQSVRWKSRKQWKGHTRRIPHGVTYRGDVTMYSNTLR